ncbi:STM4014 family protein [Streptosporangium sandarakinum]|uniref:STM4014 family protein n=1 Tax=Streptosporangium sandarakinum TaxID=1260955 RepID=UPI003D8A878C
MTEHGDRTPVRTAVVGTPGDRRVTLFAAACARYGLPAPAVVPWTGVLRDEEIRFEPGTLVRIESPGQDAEADALLRGPGRPTRAGGGAAWHAALTAGLDRIRRAVARTPGAVLLADVDEIAVMFDKRRCHARLAAAGVPVPPALPGPVGGYAELRERMDRAGWRRVFVKPAHGSSASGVVALQVAGSRIKAVTSAELIRGGAAGAGPYEGERAGSGPHGDGWAGGGLREDERAAVELHNSLRVRSYGDEDEVAAIIDLLAADGLHVERWFPKAGFGGRVIDLRVVTVGGTPTHAVVRAARAPMTNLHLGGVRGDLGAVRARLGPRGWERVLDACARAAACFPGSLCAGVDVMVGADWRGVAVAEVNAFGDLLPGLTGLPGGVAEGLDTYAAQVRAVLARHVPVHPPAGAPAGHPSTGHPSAGHPPAGHSSMGHPSAGHSPADPPSADHAAVSHAAVTW